MDQAPRVANGSHSELDGQTTLGICFASRCHTIDELVATCHQYCEDSAIFIPGARRAVGTELAFSFDLVNAESVLLGVGTVVEEFATDENRFGRAGIVVTVKKLKRDSVDVFKRLLAARNDGRVDQQTPLPMRGRAMTGPIALDELRQARRSTRPFEVHIPITGATSGSCHSAGSGSSGGASAAGASPIPKARTGTLLGLPRIAAVPGKQAVLQIPERSPRIEARGSRPVLVPDATKRPAETPDTVVEAVPGAFADVEEDTLHDDFPFALRNELRLREQCAPVVTLGDVDSGWDIEPTPTPAAELGAEAAPEAIFDHAETSASVCDPIAVPEPVALPPPPIATFPVAPGGADAIPVSIARVASDALTTPMGAALRDPGTEPEERPAGEAYPPSWATYAVVAAASALFVAAIAIIGVQSFVSREPLLPSASEPPPLSFARTTTPSAEAPVATPARPLAACERQPAPRELHLLAPSPEQRATAAEPPVAPREQAVPSDKRQVHPYESPVRTTNAPTQKSSHVKRRRGNEARSYVAAKREPSAPATKRRCATLDCL